MKKLSFILFISILLIGCSESKKELYNETDKFVLSLEKDYKSYGALGGLKYSVTTQDGLYSITPVGRLINVKIMRVAESGEYESLRKELENHYKNDTRVNRVYICKAGTIMIDCRK